MTLDGELFGYALLYTVRCYNLFHVKRGHQSSATDKMKSLNEHETKKPTTYPFGAKVMGSAVYREREFERMETCIYLGPKTGLGSGFLGLPFEVGIPRTVKEYKAGKLIEPLEWSKEALRDLGTVFVDMDDDDRSWAPPVEETPQRRLRPTHEEIVVPAAGAPAAWIREHGYTSGCGACDIMKEEWDLTQPCSQQQMQTTLPGLVSSGGREAQAGGGTKTRRVEPPSSQNQD